MEQLAMDEPNIPKQRGRPKGKNRRPLKKWDPKIWRPVYELMVYRAMQGASNIQIGKEFDYTPQQVSNILTCPQAIRIKAELIEETRNKVAGSTSARIQQVQDLTLKRTYEYLTDDQKAKNAPALVIQTGLAVIRAFSPKENVVPQPGGNNTFVAPGATSIQNAVVLTGEQSKAIAAGLKELVEVKKIHAGK